MALGGFRISPLPSGICPPERGLGLPRHPTPPPRAPQPNHWGPGAVESPFDLEDRARDPRAPPGHAFVPVFFTACLLQSQRVM